MKSSLLSRQNQTGKQNAVGKKALAVAGAAMLLLAADSAVNGNTTNPITGQITAYAAEQTPNWFQDGSVWKVKDGAGNIVTNAWFCDLDGAWYLLDENGAMREGFINDNGHYYSLETSHTGHYGMMRTDTNIYDDWLVMTFQQEHNGYYGEILTFECDGIYGNVYGNVLSIQEALEAAGMEVTDVDGLPSASVYAKDFTAGSANVNPPQNQQNYQYLTPDDIAAIEKEIAYIASYDQESLNVLKEEIDYMLANEFDSLSPTEKEEIFVINDLIMKYLNN